MKPHKVTLPGFKDKLGLPDAIEVEYPFISQLYRFDPVGSFEVILPEQLHNLGPLLGECLAQLNYMRGIAYAAWHNKEAIIAQAERLSKIAADRDPNKEIAIVVGNGFTADRFFEGKDWSRYDIFSCWHAYPKLIAQKVRPDYLLHLDWRMPDDLPRSIDYFGINFIGTCSAAPQFWELAVEQGKHLYAYFDPADPMDHQVAEFLHEDLHPKCHGTVAEMLLHVPALAGYKQVVMVGVDLLEYPTQPPEESPYFQYKEYLEAIPKLYPDVTFYDAGIGGIYKRGFKELDRSRLNDGAIGKKKQRSLLHLPLGYKRGEG